MVVQRLLDSPLGWPARRIGFQPDLPVEELELRYANYASQFVEVNGARVHYRDEGPADDESEDPPLLCLHGTFSSLHTYDGWVDELADDRRVVRLDLAGHGLTGPHDDGYRMDEFVAFLHEFVTSIGLDGFAIAGNSRGGEVAWRYALDHTDRVDALVLVDSMGFPFETRPDGIEHLNKPLVPHVFRWLTRRDVVAEGVADVYGDPSLVTDELVDRYYDLLRREGNRAAIVSMLQRDLDPTFRHDELQSLSVPTLILWGEADELLDPSRAHRFHEAIPESTLQTYEGVGHVPMEETPGRTADDVAAFLEREA